MGSDAQLFVLTDFYNYAERQKLCLSVCVCVMDMVGSLLQCSWCPYTKLMFLLLAAIKIRKVCKGASLSYAS